jgi:hypothetical protein
LETAFGEYWSVLEWEGTIAEDHTIAGRIFERNKEYHREVLLYC